MTTESEPGVGFLLHFSQPVTQKGWSHYLGWAVSQEGVDQLLASYAQGEGPAVIVRAHLEGIKWKLVRMWAPFTVEQVREMRRTAAYGRLRCPICRSRKQQDLR